MFPLKQNKIKGKKLQAAPGWVPGWVGWSPAVAMGPAPRCPSRARPGWEMPTRRPKYPGPAATEHSSALIKAGVRGCKAVNREILAKEEQKSQCFFSPAGCRLLFSFFIFFFFPPHTQSARFLVLSGALNSSRGCKAGLVQGRDPRFAGADACKVTRSLPINYRVPP